MFSSFTTISIDRVDPYYSHELKAIVGRFPRLIDDDEVNKYFGSLSLEKMVALSNNDPSHRLSPTFMQLKDRMPWHRVGPEGFGDKNSPYNIALHRMYTFLKQHTSRYVDWSIYSNDDEEIAALFREPQLSWDGTRFRLDYKFELEETLSITSPPYRGLVSEVFSYTMFKPERRPSHYRSRAMFFNARDDLYQYWLKHRPDKEPQWDLRFLSGPYSQDNIVAHLEDYIPAGSGQEKLNKIKTTLVERVIFLKEMAKGRSEPRLDLANDMLDVFFELV